MTRFLLDTHAVIHWQLGTAMPPALSDDLDVAGRSGLVFVSAAAFWEIALLAQKGRLEIDDVTSWKNELLAATGTQLAAPHVDDMIASVALPRHHRDPFDRLFVAQARSLRAVLVSRDAAFDAYDVETRWA